MKPLYFLLISDLFLSFFVYSAERKNNLNNLEQIRTAVYNNQPKLLEQLRHSGVCFAGTRTKDGVPILVAHPEISTEITVLLLQGQASPLDQAPDKRTALDILLFQTLDENKTDHYPQLTRIELLVKNLQQRDKLGIAVIKSAKTYWNRISAKKECQKKIMSILNGKTHYSKALENTATPAQIETEVSQCYASSPTPTPSLDDQNHRNGLEQETPQPSLPGTPEIIEIEELEESEGFQFGPIERQNGIRIDNDTDEYTEIDLEVTQKEFSEQKAQNSSWWPWK